MVSTREAGLTGKRYDKQYELNVWLKVHKNNCITVLDH